MPVIDRYGIPHQYRDGSVAKPRVALTTKDIAKLVGLSKGTIYNKIGSGELVFTGDGPKDFLTLMDFYMQQKAKKENKCNP